jgi:hypothetical protein
MVKLLTMHWRNHRTNSPVNPPLIPQTLGSDPTFVHELGLDTEMGKIGGTQVYTAAENAFRPQAQQNADRKRSL